MGNARLKMEYGVHGPPLNHSIGIEGMTVSGNGIDLCYRRSLLLPVNSWRKVKLAIDVLLLEYRRISLIYSSGDGGPVRRVGPVCVEYEDREVYLGNRGTSDSRETCRWQDC